MSFLLALAPAALILALGLLLGPILPRQRAWVRWSMVGAFLVIVARYLPWRLTETVMPVDPLTFQGLYIWFLFLVELVFIADMTKNLLARCRIVDRSAEADANQARLEARPEAEWPTVDVFIPTYNEPLDVLERSIVGALALDYPHFKVWVLDDGRRDWLRDFCKEKGAGYLRRPDNAHAKAGNMNHGLAQTEGALVAVLDADFVPHRNFLRRTVGFFDEPGIGILQTPQHFFNRDPVQRNLWMTEVLPDEQRLFFDRMAPSLDAWDSMFCCGSCSVMRRAALEKIGGVPTASITEDILTTLEMLRAGYHTRYLNERLSIGLAAETLEAFFVQRARWCQGGIQTLFLPAGPLGKGVSLVQRVLLFPIYWVFHIPARLLVLLVPVFYLWFDLQPLENARGVELLYWQFPVLITGWVLSYWYNGPQSMPVLADGPAVLISWRLFPVVASSLIRPFGRPFKVTPKGSATEVSEASLLDILFLGGLLILSITGLFINVPSDLRIVDNADFLGVAGFWILFNGISLALALFICFEVEGRPVQEFFPVRLGGRLTGAGAENARVLVRSLSLERAYLNLDPAQAKGVTGGEVSVSIEGFPLLKGTLRRSRRHDWALELEGMTSEQRDRLIVALYTSGVDNSAKPRRPWRLVGGLWRRFMSETPQAER